MVLSSEKNCNGFWDQYERTCNPCEIICVDDNLIQECTDNCKDYIHNTMITQEAVKEDIHKLTIMVAATAAMTSLVLIILFLLVIIKVNKKKRKAKGILPYTVYNVSSDKVDINTKADKTIKVAEKSGDSGNVSGTTNNVSGTTNNVSCTTNNDESVLSAAKLESSRSVMSGLLSMPSVGTVTTQLSDETLQNGFNRYSSTQENTSAHNRRGSCRSMGRGKINMAPNSRSTTSNNISRSSLNKQNNTSRFPSEDCVIDSEGGCHNLAMDSSSTSNTSPVPLSQVV